jgi:hypothetical protein
MGYEKLHSEDEDAVAVVTVSRPDERAPRFEGR